MPPRLPDGFARTLVHWQRQHGRQDLPWQHTRDPYRVWLSEVMLQQTQVQTVLAYYDAFLQRFPDVQALAAAPQDDVLAAWSGLGYYSRARNLHRCAQVVVAQHQGRFPEQADALHDLPGIGRSTAAAIAAFCFHERAAILDGNVKRVLSRVAAYGADLSRAAAVEPLWTAATQALPARRDAMPAYTQGLMDLGATVCLPRKPRCAECPVRSDCAAFAEGEPTRYPLKSRRLKRGVRDNYWLCLVDGDRMWFGQQPARGVWGGLWTWPLLDDEESLHAALRALAIESAEPLPPRVHALTHLDWTLRPVRALRPARGPDVAEVLGPGRWVRADEALQLGLPAPLRKLLTT